MDCSLAGSSVHGIFQARVLEWGAIAFSESTPQMSLYHTLLLPLKYLIRCHLLGETLPDHAIPTVEAQLCSLFLQAVVTA